MIKVQIIDFNKLLYNLHNPANIGDKWKLRNIM